MPSRNIIKQFTDGRIYHVYNRGVEKRKIFLDHQDYDVLQNRIIGALQLPQSHDDLYARRNNHMNGVELIEYCLMPNHYHLMLRQKQEGGISAFMRTIFTSYSMYFNKKHDRVGPLFQGIFKAADVTTDEYLMHLSRYIHLNPQSLGQDYQTYPYSSYQYFMNGNSPAWLNPNPVLELFSSPEAYAEFVADLAQPSEELLGDMVLE